MIIHKILNNNAVVIVDEHGVEKIVMGKGLAFQKKVGENFDPEKIDKIYALTNIDALNKFQQLIVDIPLEHVEMAESIISLAKSKLGKKYNEIIYISLTDHIYTSIVRFLDGIVVKNALLWDIRRFYKDEFSIGLTALDMIEEKFNIRLPEDEAGFIALHLVNAEMEDGNMQNMFLITQVMQEVTNIVKYVFKVKFDEDSVYYYRFITHLKFFAQRLTTKKKYEESNDNLLDVVKLKYQNSYNCVNKIADFIVQKYNYELSNDEKLFLTIHIERIVYKTNN